MCRASEQEYSISIWVVSMDVSSWVSYVVYSMSGVGLRVSRWDTWDCSSASAKSEHQLHARAWIFAGVFARDWSYRPSSGHVFVKESNQPAGRALSTASKEADSIRLATVKPDIVPANTAACAPNGSRSTPEPDMRSRAPAEPCDRSAMCDRGQPTDDRPTGHRLARTKGANAWALPHARAMHIARGIAISIVCAKFWPAKLDFFFNLRVFIKECYPMCHTRECL